MKREMKQWGRVRAFYAAFMRGIGRWFRIHAVMIRPHVENPRMPELANNRTVKIATREELLTASRDPALEMSPKFLDAAEKRGELCVAVFENGRIIAYTWRGFGPTPHMDGIWVAFGKPYRYGFKALTRPEYRQQGLQNVINLFSDPLMLKMGYPQGISFVETHNYPSLISNFRRGNVVVGYAGYFRLFGKVMPFRTPGAKRHGFRFFVPDSTGMRRATDKGRHGKDSQPN